MATIEDLLEDLHDGLLIPTSTWFASGRDFLGYNIKEWDQNFLENVVKYTKKGGTLSTKQAQTAIKLLTKYKHLFDDIDKCIHSSSIVESVCKSPNYRIEPYQTRIIKPEVRHVVDDILCFRFKYDDNIISSIKRLVPCKIFIKDYSLQTILTKYPYCEKGLWFVKITCDNVEDVTKCIMEYEFHYTDEVLKVIADAMNAKVLPSTAIIENDKIKMQANNNEFLVYWLQYLIDCEGANVFKP